MYHYLTILQSAVLSCKIKFVVLKAVNWGHHLVPLYKSRIGRTLCSFMQRILLEFRRSSGYPGEGVGKKNGKLAAFRK